MALSKSKPHLLRLPFLAFFLLLLNKAKSQDSARFHFPNFFPASKHNINLQGDALLSRGTLQLTDTDEYGHPFVNPSLGRASYAKPVRIWDRTTGRVACFSTSFSFLIKPPPPESGSIQAEGLAFFIAPVGFDIPTNSAGKYLTLFNDSTALKPFMNQVLAVEFDTRVNYKWDPPYQHIGIDVNSIKSEATVEWDRSDVLSGSKARAHIVYDAESKILTITLNYRNGRSYRLEHGVDFTGFLPEWVTVGFSGATGQGAETHNILSWDFSTTWHHQSVSAKKEKSNDSARSAV